MENKETAIKETDKIIETLTKELDSLTPEGLHEFFKFFYTMNHNQANMITPDNFEEFLEVFDTNPFKVNDDKRFRKQLTDATNMSFFFLGIISTLSLSGILKIRRMIFLALF